MIQATGAIENEEQTPFMKYEFHPFTEIFPMMPSHEIDALAADIKKFGQRVPIVIYGGKILLSTGDRAKIAALLSIESDVGCPSKPEENAANAAITQSEAAEMMAVCTDSVQRAKAKLRGKKPPPPKTQPENGEVVDDNGTPVPATAMAYWNRQAEAKNVLNQIRAAKSEVKKLLPDDPMWCEVNLNGVLGDLQSAVNRFTAAIPAYVCLYCKGTRPDGCRCCKGRGCISRFMWSQAVPEELKRGSK